MREYYTEKERPAFKEMGAEVFYQGCAPGMIAAHAHIHSSTELLWIVRGSYRISADGQDYEASEGDLILLRPYTIHHATAGKGGENGYHVVKIRSSLLQEFFSDEASDSPLAELTIARAGAKVLWGRDEVEAAGLLPALRDLTDEETDRPFREMGLRVGAARLLLLLLRDLRGRSDGQIGVSAPPGAILKIHRALLFINRHCTEDLSEEECAREVGFSRSHFSRLFSSTVGTGFRQYLLEARLHRAERELLTTDRAVSEIASSVGFNSVAYFIARFRTSHGMTPTAYRRAQLDKPSGK